MNINYSILKNNINNFLEYFMLKKTYVRILKNKIETIQRLKSSGFRAMNPKLLSLTYKSLKNKFETVLSFKRKTTKIDESLVVMYVLDITITRSNSYLNIFDSAGKLKLSVSAGNMLDLSAGKRKTVRFFLLNSMFKLIAKQKYLIGKPIAMHLKNKVFIPNKFLRKLKKKRFLKSITFFHKVPFNGCRKKKVRSV